MIADPAELDKRLTAHEAVCAERYLNIVARLGRVEKILLGVAGSLIAGMTVALWQIAAVATQLAGR